MWTVPVFLQRYLICAIAVALSACGAAPVKTPTAPVAAPPPPVATPAPPPLSPRERTVQALLADAESAMSQGRFSLPAHDNAYDRFRAVQLLDGGNKQALAGMHSILLVYVDRIQQSLSGGRLHAAAADLRQAEQLFPGAELLSPLRTELSRRSKSSAVAVKAPIPADGRERISLPAQPLKDKTEDVKQMLVKLANRVRESDESVMIYARTDAEGRWIYKTMKDAVGDYRIRGDIRINRQPAIELLSPLE